MLENVLSWLTSSDGGALLLVLWFVSWALEEMDWWHTLDSRVRSIAILVTSVVIALLAVILQRNPALVAAVEPYFQPAYYVILAWLATQTVHKLNRSSSLELVVDDEVVSASADVTVEAE